MYRYICLTDAAAGNNVVFLYAEHKYSYCTYFYSKLVQSISLN